MANFHARMMNIQGRPASMIAGSAQSWNEGHRHARHEAAQIALEADTRIEQLEAQVRAADALAVAIERRMVDLGGFDNRFGLRKAMEDYYRATKEGGA